MDKQLTFEEAMQNLEAIANELEKGDLSLEESVAKFEEAKIRTDQFTITAK